MTNIAIIGAGLSGLTLATYLQTNANVHLFEKSRGVGGRLATRRAEPYQFDHGAQFFTVKTDAFRCFIQPMLSQGIIKPWPAKFVEISERTICHRRVWQDHPEHYVGVPTMNAMAKYLSKNLTITHDTRVQSVVKDKQRWCLINQENESLGYYDWVISTVPAQQALELLPDDCDFYQQLNSVNMQACFSLMLGFENDLCLDFDAALVRNEDVSWLSINSNKPHRNTAFSLLINSTNQWANKHIDDDKQKVLSYLIQQASQIIQRDLNQANHQAIHAWRYANIAKQSSNQPYFIDENRQLAVAGDWLIQGRVEAAFTSGANLAQHLLGVI